MINPLDPLTIGSDQQPLVSTEVDAEAPSFIGPLVGIDELDVVHSKFRPARSQAAVQSPPVRCEDGVHQPLSGFRCLAVGYRLPQLGFAVSMELVDKSANSHP